MRHIIFALIGATMALSVTTAWADQWVDGYTRNDGTYVQGHYRSEPNDYKIDNYSYDGNVNPYTGEIGSKIRDHSTVPDYRTDYKTDHNYGYDSDLDSVFD